tara:strand:+ start:9599 stop:9745 length:147 start_codon:yes stop_codon:yes gene_type:complete
MNDKMSNLGLNEEQKVNQYGERTLTYAIPTVLNIVCCESYKLLTKVKK